MDISDMKNICDYYDLNVQSNTLLLAANIFENLNICLKTHDLDPARFYSAPRWQHKKTKIKLEL